MREAEKTTAKSDDATSHWESYFGFETPYENQRDAIETAISVCGDRGYLAMEGPCGTGKTMAALTAAATLIREGTYKNAVVVTPVKQQRQQFIEDLRTLNANISDPLSGVALVGKRDLCPYGREGLFPDDVGVHDRCEDLRENTADLVDGEGSAAGETVGTVAIPGAADDDIWWDSTQAAQLAREARADVGQQGFGEGLATAGVESPYRKTQPSAADVPGSDNADETLYCPFEADWYARNRGSPLGFEAGINHVITAEEYLPEATERGTCPHRVMRVLLDHAEIVIGNYNHLFEPESRALIASILNDETLVIVDEAHRLEERVRDLLSMRLGTHTITRAGNDIRTLLRQASESDEKAEVIEMELEEKGVPRAALARAVEFYDDLLDWLDDRIETALAEELDSWPAPEVPPRDIEIPLRDPETVEPDELTRWAEREGYTGELWRSLSKIGGAVELALEAVGLSRNPVCAPVGALLERWWNCDHARYFREIELEHSPKDSDGWEGHYTAGLVLFECMPANSLREIFDDLGGGILMSATLEPLSVFREVAGLSALEENRRVVERTYDLPFPEKNRASWIVDADAFTAYNRGNPEENADSDRWNRTRDEYAHVLRTIARSRGNVLIAMPNYREAEWAGTYLEDVVEKPVFVDTSSSFEETEQLKQTFFKTSEAVLVTSARGTLTEGVDYDGEKLHCCAVVGVPLVNIGSPRVQAIQRAYGDAFGEENAFAYALTVPAVRRARQTIGRVIRGADERGVRAFVGNRYVPDARHSVYEFLSPGEREEFMRVTPEFLGGQLEQFWTDE